MVDQDPTTPAADVVYASGTVCADILIQRFNNTKGAGVVRSVQPGDPTKKGLALILYDAGNSDRLTLATVAGDTNGGLVAVGERGARLGHRREQLVSRGHDGVWSTDTDSQSHQGQVFTSTTEVRTNPNSAITGWPVGLR